MLCLETEHTFLYCHWEQSSSLLVWMWRVIFKTLHNSPKEGKEEKFTLFTLQGIFLFTKYNYSTWNFSRELELTTFLSQKNLAMVVYNSHEFQFKSERPWMKSHYLMCAVVYYSQFPSLVIVLPLYSHIMQFSRPRGKTSVFDWPGGSAKFRESCPCSWVHVQQQHMYVRKRPWNLTFKTTIVSKHRNT